MSVQKIESIEWHYHKERAGDGIIEIELRDLFEPYLLNTSYCDRVTIWWDTHTGDYDESVKVYAIDELSSLDEAEPIISKVESWYEPDITEALKYVSDNLM